MGERLLASLFQLGSLIRTPMHDTCCHHIHEHASLGEHAGRDAVCVDAVTYRYPESDKLVLDAVTLHVRAGESVGIIGPNGAGKTTLVKIMLGQLVPTSTSGGGDVHIENMSPRQACRRGDVIGYVPQRHDVTWNFPLSVAQVVAMGLTTKLGPARWLLRSSQQQRAVAARVDEVLEQVGVAPLRDRPIGSLSGGQQQRVFLARALVHEPSVLVLDEPLTGVDAAGRDAFSQLLRKLHTQRRFTMMMVSHDLAAVAAGCDSVACLNRKIHYHAAPGGLTRQVLMEVFEHDVVGMTENTSEPGAA